MYMKLRFNMVNNVIVHADKPPIEELHQFLEFQLPRQWAPVFSDLPLGPQRKQQSSSSLKFSLMGSKLFVNTNPVNTFTSDHFGFLHFMILSRFSVSL